jgi:hypothetical protein
MDLNNVMFNYLKNYFIGKVLYTKHACSNVANYSFKYIFSTQVRTHNCPSNVGSVKTNTPIIPRSYNIARLRHVIYVNVHHIL